MKRLDFIFFDAGGGHRSAAFALKGIVEQQQRPWEVRLVNLQEVLDSMDIFRKYAGVRMQDIYNQMLKKGYTIGSKPLLQAMHTMIRTYHRGQVRLLDRFWRNSSPDLVVSLIPNFNRALYDGLRRADRACRRAETPLVTILTDLADYPPHFWIEPQPQYFICGTRKAAEQALALGHPRECIFETSGMILRPQFYEEFDHDIAAEREKIGLRPDLPTGVVLFGGHGSPWMAGVARRIAASDLKVQLIQICGRNRKLRDRLRRLNVPFPMHIEGFTSDVPYFMHLADFFIGKPGPGSISEALAMRLPVVVERNRWTLIQERYNTDWVQQNQVGLVLNSFHYIVDGLQELLQPDTYNRLRANAAKVKNRAVFEIPEILDSIMQRQTPPVRSFHQ